MSIKRRLTKFKKAISEKIDLNSNKIYNFLEAVQSLQSLPKRKFNQNMEVAISLGIDPKKSDQNVRGAVVLPNGTGKSVKVAVFTQGANVEQAKQAGADKIGMQDLADDIKNGNIDFDVVIASPDAMGVVGRLGQVLGPRGLMPNPKVGTVTTNIATAVKNAKGGQVRYRADKSGIIHCIIGKEDFTVDQLQGNLQALIADLKRAKPSTSKGIYFRKLTLTTTMGPGLSVDFASLES